MGYVPAGPRNRPSLDPTLALLVADDPRGQARKLLDHVATRCRARGAAVGTGVAGAEIERQRLMAALERHEWDIARVARLIGVTRRTIYLRLKRYKIHRQRVPKTLKPCPPLEEA